MAINRRFSDKINNARFENTTLNSTEQVQQQEWDERGGQGYYQKTNLEDMINNFLATHIGDDKVLRSAPRHEVAFWGQRAVQEFSYDVFYAEKNIELELNPDVLAIALPADYVNYVKISWTDPRGNEHTIHPSRIVNGKQAILQDNEYNQLYDNTGTAMLANKSEGLERFQDPNVINRIASLGRSYYYGSIYDGDYYDSYYNQYYGRRYGLDPQFENYNGTFVLDTYKGMIYFDSSFARSLIGSTAGDENNLNTAFISLRYISDGLGENGDLDQVFIHKFAEDAIYSSILYNLVKLRPSVAQLAPLFKREAKAKMNNTKIRLFNMKTEEMTQVMRGKSKWIKH